MAQPTLRRVKISSVRETEVLEHEGPLPPSKVGLDDLDDLDDLDRNVSGRPFYGGHSSQHLATPRADEISKKRLCERRPSNRIGAFLWCDFARAQVDLECALCNCR